MKILFLCVANSARSQIAEGLAKKILGEEFSIQSAGSNPSGRVHRMAIQVLEEMGVDPSEQFSKSWDQMDLHSMDLIITLCAEEVCPVVPIKVKKLHWPIPDPAAVGGTNSERLEAFRKTRELLRERIETTFRA